MTRQDERVAFRAQAVRTRYAALQRLQAAFGILVAALAGCQAGVAPDLEGVFETLPAKAAIERPATLLSLQGSLTQPEAEVSGLAWYGDTLVLLPQYPHRWGNNLYGLRRQDIAAALQGDSTRGLEPFPIPLASADALRVLEGYEGVEAIAFQGDTVFISVEARMRGFMQGYLIQGAVTGDLEAIRLDPQSTVTLAPQTRFMNKAYEALLPLPDGVAALYEVNGQETNAAPVALRYARALPSLSALPFPSIEYRITDATAIQADGTFWVVNFHWPGEKRIQPAADGISERWLKGPSHARTDIVERILALRYRQGRIELVDAPPIEIAILNETVARNWEGIALWGQEGFLIVTDQFPTTLLAFVAR